MGFWDTVVLLVVALCLTGDLLISLHRLPVIVLLLLTIINSSLSVLQYHNCLCVSPYLLFSLTMDSSQISSVQCNLNLGKFESVSLSVCVDGCVSSFPGCTVMTREL